VAYKTSCFSMEAAMPKASISLEALAYFLRCLQLCVDDVYHFSTMCTTRLTMCCHVVWRLLHVFLMMFIMCWRCFTTFVDDVWSCFCWRCLHVCWRCLPLILTMFYHSFDDVYMLFDDVSTVVWRVFEIGVWRWSTMVVPYILTWNTEAHLVSPPPVVGPF
jgi:hypothetical protein